MMDFNPPIKERETEELLEILGTPKSWNPDVIKLAETELKNRKVDKDRVEAAKHLSKKVNKIKSKVKADESLLSDFIRYPAWTIIVTLFSWELKKDGFDRKAKEQKIIRMIILVGIIIIGMISFNLI